MKDSLCFPIDELTGESRDFDRAADYLELTAFFAHNSAVATSDLANQAGIGAEEDHADLDEEMRSGEEDLVTSTVERLEHRMETLGSSAYPFHLGAGGAILSCNLKKGSLGHAAYILSLVLSNLRSVSPVLDASRMHPDDNEVRRLREFFQYFATAALATEIQGSAWSFGFPRPDGSGFITKLKEIWQVLADGQVEAQVGAPSSPKDDKVDIFAARLHRDRLPGFLLAAAQVATGANAREKSLKGHLGTFKSRWFARQPATEFLTFMIVPFAVGDRQFLDCVRVMGNVLHRLRVPRRVEEAAQLVQAGKTIEGYDQLGIATQWVEEYRGRAKVAA